MLDTSLLMPETGRSKDKAALKVRIQLPDFHDPELVQRQPDSNRLEVPKKSNLKAKSN